MEYRPFVLTCFDKAGERRGERETEDGGGIYSSKTMVRRIEDRRDMSGYLYTSYCVFTLSCPDHKYS